MKRPFLTIICLGLVLFGRCLLLGAQEIELIAGVNNMTFHPDRETTYGKDANSTQFEGYPFIFGDFIFRAGIFENTKFIFHIARDNILQNSLNCKLAVNTGNFNMEFGAFIGISDTFEKPDAGITGSIEFISPGILMVSLDCSSSLGFQNEFLGKNHRETAGIKIGFWLPHVIPSFSASVKSFTRQPENSVTIQDELVRLQLSGDMFAKNFPLTVRIDCGMEILSRSYKRGNSDTADKLNAIFTGFEAKWQVSKPLRIIAGFEMPIFYITANPMSKPEFSLYKFYGGVAYTLF